MSNITRASFVTLGLLVGSSTIAGATPVVADTIVHQSSTTTDIKLDDTTVLCSAADYGALHLKVLIPQLAGLTLLNHQNTGAGAPCVAAGRCLAGNMPENIIDAKRPTETVTIDVKEIRRDLTDAGALTCTTSLIERVHVTIRGFEFTHERRSDLGARDIGDCAAGSADQPADGAGSDNESSSAGCATTNAGAGALPLVALAAIAVIGVIRRRRHNAKSLIRRRLLAGQAEFH
jgi:MYXO-CTERM domain-containing protein